VYKELFELITKDPINSNVKSYWTSDGWAQNFQQTYRLAFRNAAHY